jgi:hypothetical protein
MKLRDMWIQLYCFTTEICFINILKIFSLTKILQEAERTSCAWELQPKVKWGFLTLSDRSFGF